MKPRILHAKDSKPFRPAGLNPVLFGLASALQRAKKVNNLHAVPSILGPEMRKEGQDKESLEEGNLQETLLLILIGFALGFAVACCDPLEDRETRIKNLLGETTWTQRLDTTLLK